MNRLNDLKTEMSSLDTSEHILIRDIYMYNGYKQHYADEKIIARAYATAQIFKSAPKYIYANDLILGSVMGNHKKRCEINEAELEYAKKIADSFGRPGFHNNVDHFTPDYEGFLSEGVCGVRERIKASTEKHSNDEKKLRFLKSADITMEAFSDMIAEYAVCGEEKAKTESGKRKEELEKAASICRKISTDKPESFREALQLVWLVHTAFCMTGRFAMALGRLDQYLYSFYENDIKNGILTDEEATELLCCTLYKINERAMLPNEPKLGGSDVVNIAIGGVKRDGSDAANKLSEIIMEAVKRCNISGPNLSARFHSGTPEFFWDKALELIGTGLGYPALMNDEATIPALIDCGYKVEDCRDYSMVGCIEAFISGKQPPWADGRFNTPKYLELALNNGRCMQTDFLMGIETGDAAELDTMEKLLEAFTKQMEFGVYETFAKFDNENRRYEKEQYSQPFLSCFAKDCIGRGQDINDGGCEYPSAYGMGCMGIATVADSLAAIEKVVYNDKSLTLSQLRDILKADFEGYEDVRKLLLSVPKYGNNDDFVDKYAVWFVDIHAKLFEPLRTRDGGRVYIGIASNISNIPAGREVAASADGRRNAEPLSDASSPMRGMDKDGITGVVLSTSKPDFKKVACGTVLNQKLTPDGFDTKEKRDKLKALLKVYFARGGQEIQINSVSREILEAAMENPEGYESLVVRVSGFSGFYTKLSRDVQKDILKRTEKTV